LLLALTMAPAEGRNVRNKLFSTILAVLLLYYYTLYLL